MRHFLHPSFVANNVISFFCTFKLHVTWSFLSVKIGENEEMSQVTLKVFSTLKQKFPPKISRNWIFEKNLQSWLFSLNLKSLASQCNCACQFRLVSPKKSRKVSKNIFWQVGHRKQTKGQKNSYSTCCGTSLFDDFPFCGFKTQRELVEARANLTRGPHSFIMQKENHWMKCPLSISFNFLYWKKKLPTFKVLYTP